ncbi:hypothetical protein RB601_006480 [Gaeumannomyces tritici]
MIDRPEYTRIEKPNTRGKVLDGSSCLNYYTWIPGSAATYDDWVPYGGAEWGEKLRYMGAGGPLPVSHPDLIPEAKPFRDALERAWVSKGEPLTDDVHGGTMRGLWRCTNSIYNGKRSSSWLFLEGKRNVTVPDHTHAKRLVIEGGRAAGIEAIGPDGEATLDGCGLDRHLLRAGLEKDAAVSAYRWKYKGPYTSGLLELVGLPRIDEQLAACPEYAAYKAANGGVDPFGPGGQPHFEIDFVPMFSDALQWHIPCPPAGDHLTVIVDLLRPLSRSGAVTLNSADPLEQAKIDINFFWHDLDLVAMREGVRWVDDAMETMIKERSQTGFHPCGTNRMAKSIDEGVVDANLKVFGVDRLRVIDASIIPVIPDCRIQMAVYAIGEKGADMIKAAHPDLYSG